jgi:hypothetical protein
MQTQGWVLQARVSVSPSWKGQGWPVPEAGVVTLKMTSSKPPPHVAEQLPGLEK